MTEAFLYDNLNIYLYLGIFLLCCGILGILYRRTLIAMLISMELIMNGVGLNLVAFNRFVSPMGPDGMVFTLFVMGLAAAEAAIALAIIILVFRRYKSIESTELEEMKD
jgi:NADH-quinone oxidoreductase subunit K